MNPHCECDGPGFCSRHKIKKNENLYKHCKGLATHKPDCGFRYWLAWEEGRMGATAPEEPITVNDWNCDAGRATVTEFIPGTPPRQSIEHTGADSKILPRPTASKIGDVLSEQFSALGIKPIKGCSCKQVQHQLNSQSPQAILSNVNHWAVVVRTSARKWQELKGGVWNIVPTPPLALFRKLLQDAAQKELNECSGHTE